MADFEIEAYSGTCKTHGNFSGESIAILGKKIKRGCPECIQQEADEAKAREAEEAKREEEIRAYESQKRLELSGVPARFANKSLDTFVITNDGQELALESCRRLVQAIKQAEKAPNLVFIGKPGTGKTHLSCGVIRELYMTKRVRRIDLPDLIREIRSTWHKKSERTESEVLDFYGKIDLLIIEEIGTGAGSEDEKARIFQVINRRYEAMLPTVIISNLDIKTLREEIGERVLDRLREGDRALLTFDWPSMRGAV